MPAGQERARLGARWRRCPIHEEERAGRSRCRQTAARTESGQRAAKGVRAHAASHRSSLTSCAGTSATATEEPSGETATTFGALMPGSCAGVPAVQRTAVAPSVATTTEASSEVATERTGPASMAIAWWSAACHTVTRPAASPVTTTPSGVVAVAVTVAPTGKVRSSCGLAVAIWNKVGLRLLVTGGSVGLHRQQRGGLQVGRSQRDRLGGELAGQRDLGLLGGDIALLGGLVTLLVGLRPLADGDVGRDQARDEEQREERDRRTPQQLEPLVLADVLPDQLVAVDPADGGGDVGDPLGPARVVGALAARGLVPPQVDPAGLLGVRAGERTRQRVGHLEVEVVGRPVPGDVHALLEDDEDPLGRLVLAPPGDLVGDVLATGPPRGWPAG